MMALPKGTPLFPLGRLVATLGALALLAGAGGDPARLLARHAFGDWGEVPPEDARENELSVREGFRIVSSYPVGGDGARVWIITEADRFST
nr:hypothetical protein [Rubrobacter xylanophilus]